MPPNGGAGSTGVNAATVGTESGPCEDGAVQPCGPQNENGPCQFGSRSCVNGTWGECVGAVLPGARLCNSGEDNDCDGVPDNTVDNVCTCVIGESQACDAHPGRDGNGICRAGTRTCVPSPNGRTAQFGPCEGSVGPAGTDSCSVPGDDSNCDGVANGDCSCSPGDQSTCAQEHGSLGSCAERTLICSNFGQWPPASACAPSSPEICGNDTDDDCDGVVNDVDACDECTETCFCEGGSCAELVDIDAGSDHVCVLTSSGNVWCWGQNDSGQLGVAGFQNAPRPRRVAQVAGVRDIETGAQAFTCALQSDQTVVCWGSASGGQLGNNSGSGVSFSPVQVITDNGAALSQITKIASGNDFTCALRGSDGSVHCWGGLVGDGRQGVSLVAVATRRSVESILLTAGDIAAGDSFAIARAGAGWVSWGNAAQELGQGDVAGSPFARAILGQPNPSFEVAAAGPFGACATTAAGEAYCWGDDGLLAALGSDDLDTPARFAALDDTRSFALGESVGLIMDGNATLQAFGDADNPSSGLGGTLTGYVPPTPVPNVGAVKLATVGNDFACAILVDDTVRCWGRNGQGQLGNGTTTDSVAPTTALPVRERTS